MPKAAPGLYTSWKLSQSPTSGTGRWASVATAIRLVRKSTTTTPHATIQKTKRLAPLAIFFLGFALDAEAGVRQRIEPLEVDLVAALLAFAELLGAKVEAAERFIDVPQVAPFLGREQELFLALHRVRALVGHVEGVRRQVAVRTLQRGAEGFLVMA